MSTLAESKLIELGRVTTATRGVVVTQKFEESLVTRRP